MAKPFSVRSFIDPRDTMRNDSKTSKRWGWGSKENGVEEGSERREGGGTMVTTTRRVKREQVKSETERAST